MSEEKPNIYFKLNKRNSAVLDEQIDQQNIIQPKSPVDKPNQNMHGSLLYSESLACEDYKGNNDGDKINLINQSGVYNIIEQPNFVFYVSLSVSSNQITEIFLNIASKLQYTVLDQEQSYVIAMKKRKITLKDLIFRCLQRQNSEQPNSIIKIQIHTNKQKCQRKVIIKCIQGEVHTNLILINMYKNYLKNKINNNQNSIENISQTQNFMDYAFISQQKQIEDEEDYESQNNPITLETTASFMFHKILCATNYGVGKKISSFLKEFEIQFFENKELSSQKLPQPIEKLHNLVSEIVENLFSEFNYGRNETKTIMPYCRISVEKYIYGKVYEQLMELYIIKYKQKIARFEEKKQIIQKNFNTQQIYEHLDVPKQFWLLSEEQINQQDEQMTKSESEQTSNQNQQENNQISENLPYELAINELSKIQSYNSPREKLKCILMLRSLMRTAVIDYHYGKEELNNMDEELTILIFIILKSKVNNLVAEIAMVEDFVMYDSSFETERRVVTNFKLSYQFILDEWKVNYTTI